MSLCSIEFVFQRLKVVSIENDGTTFVGDHGIPGRSIRCALHGHSLRCCCDATSFLHVLVRWLRFQGGRERSSHGRIASIAIGILPSPCSLQLHTLVHIAVPPIGRLRLFGGHCSTAGSQREYSIRVHRCELDNEKTLHWPIDLHRRERASVRGQHGYHKEDRVPL